jgi:hypothetical protein
MLRTSWPALGLLVSCLVSGSHQASSLFTFPAFPEGLALQQIIREVFFSWITLRFAQEKAVTGSEGGYEAVPIRIYV